MKLSRRTFLRASGVSLSLPLLEAMRPALGAESPAAKADEAPRRMVAICTNLGVLERHFVPKKAGADYELTPYLQTMSDVRDQLTVITGSSHPDVTGGHSAEASFLTAAPHPGAASFRNSISLDQYAAERIGMRTRFSSLSLVVAQNGNQSLSFTSDGVMLPAERSPAQVFRTLFVEGDKATVERQVEQLRVGRSILDTVGERAKSLQKSLGHNDRERLDQYFSSVREVERRLQLAQEWEKKPKPKVDVPPPRDGEHLLERLGAMYDLIRLALTTDSTRIVTLMVRTDGFGAQVPGVSDESHNLSHHVGRADKLDQLRNFELAQFVELAKLIKSLGAAKENGASLLDRTTVLYGSNLGNGNNHDNKNLPILLAGGGFKHGQHLAFDKDNNYPLPNLFVSMLQRLGIESDKFAGATGTMRGLETS